MKKKFELEDLDCANCTVKMEAAISKIEEVGRVTVSSMTQRFVIEVDESRFDDTMDQVVATCKRVEPDYTTLI